MSLSRRIVMVLLAVMVLFMVSAYAVQRLVVYPSFLALEHEEAVKDLRRGQDAIQDEISHLATFCNDWSAWTEMCEFVADGNAAFEKSNLQDSTFDIAALNLLVICNREGEVVWGEGYDVENEESMEIDGPWQGRIPTDHPTLTFDGLDGGARGLIMTNRGPLLVASKPIITSEREGPIRGAVIMGRLLDETRLQAISTRVQVPLHMWRLDSDLEALPPIEAAVHASLAPTSPPALRERDADVLLAYTTLPDLFGSPALLLRGDIDRQISARGAATARYALYSIAAAGVLLLFLLHEILRRTVGRPLARLTRHATQVGTTSDLSAVSGIEREDEIGVLARAFDEMVVNLRDSRDLLTDTARQIAVADVARSVLHNVGNILTSINVSAVSIHEAHRTSRVGGLLRATDLITQHRDDLARFLTEDDRGRVIPEYFEQAARACRAEREKLTAALESLERSGQEATQIVSRQSEFSAGLSFAQQVDLEAAVTSALSLVQPALRRHSVELDRDIPTGVLVSVDRLKLTQVLVNLLTNAKESMAGIDPGRRRLSIRAVAEQDRIRFEIRDAGCGLSSDDVKRVFERGFSTKGPGRGLGLHYCAITTREMGGSLRAASEGLGHGTTFTVEIPRQTNEANVAADRPVQDMPQRSQSAVGSPA